MVNHPFKDDFAEEVLDGGRHCFCFGVKKHRHWTHSL